jgi:hypothetical protein
MEKQVLCGWMLRALAGNSTSLDSDDTPFRHRAHAIVAKNP